MAVNKRALIFRRVAGWALIVAGVGAVKPVLDVWLWLEFHPPARYHYYFLSDEGRLSCALWLAVGAVFGGLGLWIQLKSRR